MKNIYELRQFLKDLKDVSDNLCCCGNCTHISDDKKSYCTEREIDVRPFALCDKWDLDLLNVKIRNEYIEDK